MCYSVFKVNCQQFKLLIFGDPDMTNQPSDYKPTYKNMMVICTSRALMELKIMLYQKTLGPVISIAAMLTLRIPTAEHSHTLVHSAVATQSHAVEECSLE